MHEHVCMSTNEYNNKSCVHKVPIFSSLTTDEMVEVSTAITHKDYRKGEIIYLEGESADKLIIINKGKVKVSKITGEGKEQVIRILNSGDFMGELSVFTQHSLKNSADALEDTSVCIINNKKIYELIDSNPSIGLKIIRELSIRLEKAEEMIESIGLKSVEQRLAEILLKEANDNNVVNLVISKKDLAAHLGMSKETLSRKLSSFQEKGFISQEGQRKITILDKKALEEIGSFL